MGLRLTYRAGDRELQVRLSPTDWQALAQLQQHLPEAVGLMLDTTEFAEPTTIPSEKLREALRMIDALLIERPDLLPHTYQLKSEYHRLNGSPYPDEFDTGSVGGIRLPDDEAHAYAIMAGTNELVMHKYELLANGTGKLVDEVDLRDRAELLTANMGRIRFRKRRARSSLRVAIAEIQVFLDKSKAHEVTRLVE